MWKVLNQKCCSSPAGNQCVETAVPHYQGRSHTGQFCLDNFGDLSHWECKSIWTSWVSIFSSPVHGKDCSLLPSEVTPGTELWNSRPKPALPVQAVLCSTKICERLSSLSVPWSSMSIQKEGQKKQCRRSCQASQNVLGVMQLQPPLQHWSKQQKWGFVSSWYQFITSLFFLKLFLNVH